MTHRSAQMAGVTARDTKYARVWTLCHGTLSRSNAARLPLHCQVQMAEVTQLRLNPPRSSVDSSLSTSVYLMSLWRSCRKERVGRLPASTSSENVSRRSVTIQELQRVAAAYHRHCTYATSSDQIASMQLSLVGAVGVLTPVSRLLRIYNASILILCSGRYLGSTC